MLASVNLLDSNNFLCEIHVNQGLFFANARILARLIPNLTPEVAIYLDYLRQIGDLFINYTSQSVYCLDHEHPFEVVEKPKPFNEICPMLALNTRAN